VQDAVLAASLDQRDAFWHLRESLPEAQTREGLSLKHDISVPIGDVPTLIARVVADVSKLVPGIRPVPFGHMGDGNLHFNLQAPEGMDGKAFMSHADRLHACVYRHVIALEGSVSAEHGIGRLKRAQLKDTKSVVALDLMQRIKAAFDPDGRLNPGKVLYAKDEISEE
jgi:D-lactate dehydrogenase (cytochrome)